MDAFQKLHSAPQFNKSQMSPHQPYQHPSSHHHRQFSSTTFHHPHTPTSYDGHGHHSRRHLTPEFQYHANHLNSQEHSRRDDE
jgi:hypothetical protein